jgi:hypothetical protein
LTVGALLIAAGLEYLKVKYARLALWPSNLMLSAWRTSWNVDAEPIFLAPEAFDLRRSEQLILWLETEPVCDERTQELFARFCS